MLGSHANVSSPRRVKAAINRPRIDPPRIAAFQAITAVAGSPHHSIDD
jgi:hypothetical protein